MATALSFPFYRPTCNIPLRNLLDKVPPLDEAEVKVAAEQLVKQQTVSLLKRLGEDVDAERRRTMPTHPTL
jgi:hypothetical protein